MPIAIPIWLAAKAWLMPFLAPMLGKAGLWLARGRSAVPGGTGAAIAVVAVFGLLAALLWFRVSLWLDPPPRTYTAAEIEAAGHKADAAALRQAIGEGQAALGRRDASINSLARIVDETTTELEHARSKSRNPDAVAVDADDEWLRSWHRRGW